VSTDIATLAAVAVPHITAAVQAYGTGILAKLEEAAADATVGLGGRLLRRFVDATHQPEVIEGAIVDLAEDAGDEDCVAALRLHIRKALAADPQLAAAVAEEVKMAPASIVASGERAAAAQYLSGIVVTGDGAQITR
jgi:hypothetical protein